MKQISAADKVPFTKINGKKLLFQIDKKLYKNINNYGCRFMSLIAIPQIVTGKRLTADNIKYIYDQKLTEKDILKIETLAGIKEVKILNEKYGDKFYFLYSFLF